MKWWDSIPAAHIVRVRHPYERHGLAGKTSNNAKVQLHDDFLHFVDRNSQPNGRKSDSHGATHYVMGAAMEIVQQNLLSFFRIRFMVVGHTKFDPDRLFSNIARAFNRADTFNISQLAELISQ